MEAIRGKIKGILLCTAVAVLCWNLGKMFPLAGAAVFSILVGMLLSIFIKNKTPYLPGVAFVSKKVLQWAVVLLGFGMNLSAVAKTGGQSLPIILATIGISLLIAFILFRLLRLPGNTAILIGVGSSICGGSAIAATAPVIGADDEEVAQAISVVFLFNVIAAIVFPYLGQYLGFQGSESFGIFAGTAINDTSSVTAAASAWDSMHNLGSATLDKAVTVKLTRTLAIIPITLFLALFRSSKEKVEGRKLQNIRKIFPMFILYFILASAVTTIATNFAGVPTSVFGPLKDVSKFFIVMAMAGIGFNTDIVKLVRTGARPVVLGLCCWVGIICTALVLQHFLMIW